MIGVGLCFEEEQIEWQLDDKKKDMVFQNRKILLCILLFVRIDIFVIMLYVYLNRFMFVYSGLFQNLVWNVGYSGGMRYC